MGNSKTAGIVAAYGTILIAALWLLFYHLDSHVLWGDEAETANLGRNILQSGVPSTFNGTNYVLINGSIDETPGHIWIWAPWLPDYVTAASFNILGVNTWSARAPFALLGWACLLALGRVAYQVYRNHWISMASIILLGTSEIFLLHARQCRYYSLAVFLEIIFMYGLHQLLMRMRSGIWLATVSLVLLFYTNYIIAFANLPALLMLFWLRRQDGKAALVPLAIICGVFAVAILPWLAFVHPWIAGHALGRDNYFWKAASYLLEFHFHFVPLCFFLLPLLAWLRWPRLTDTMPAPESQQWEQLLVALMPVYFLAILFVPGFYLRYLLPLLPAGCLLAVVWTFRYVKWRAFAVALLVLQASTNAIPWLTAYPIRHGHQFRLPLVEFVQGMSHPYDNQLSVVMDYLKAKAAPGEMLMSFDPELPLQFYTPLAIVDGRLSAPPKGRLPEWFLPQSASGVQARDPIPLPDFLKPYYSPATILVPGTILGDSIPEPDIYQYLTATNQVPFVLYRLKTAGAGTTNSTTQ